MERYFNEKEIILKGVFIVKLNGLKMEEILFIWYEKVFENEGFVED